MQCKKIEQVAPVQPTGDRKYLITAQKKGDILILDVFKYKKYVGRQAINITNGEYKQYVPTTGKWTQQKFGNLLDLDMRPYGYYCCTDANNRTNIDTAKMKKLIREALMGMSKINYVPDIFYLIDSVERRYGADKRQRIEDNRVMKVQEKMSLVPPLPEKAREWIWQIEGAEDYIFKDKETGKWHCTCCGKSYDSQYIETKNKLKKVRHNDKILCPKCGKAAVVKTKMDRIEKKSFFYLAQRMDDRMSAWRAFNVTLVWSCKGREIRANEATRVIMYQLSTGAKYAGEIFYNQYATNGAGWRCDYEYAVFDNKRNPAQRRMIEGYLYPEGIDTALNGTAYERCARILTALAADNVKLNYNRLVATQGNVRIIGVVEYLYKGRFFRLLQETVEDIYLFGNATYHGPLNIRGDSIEDIFGISDRQMINRIRNENGGKNMLEWMRVSEKTGKKISTETLIWLEKNNIYPNEISIISRYMSPQQIMNYVIRQQAEGYKGRTAGGVIDQWRDYLSMLGRLGKKIDDEMMYRPRELKRRHDECVEEINAQTIRENMERDKELQAKEAQKMRKQFPGAEKVLKDIREKYTYEDEQYIITVPESLMDIIAEGQALHHCAGATDRYFDRIMQRETYICFLRKKEDPNTPYYTIEVEPGGTIRQHRGYMDEEPNIEQIKPFLRKWQKEIRKRMTKADREYAAASAIKRQENIEDLKAKRNIRVLQGLMEDFMPAENEPLMAAGV